MDGLHLELCSFKSNLLIDIFYELFEEFENCEVFNKKLVVSLQKLSYLQAAVPLSDVKHVKARSNVPALSDTRNWALATQRPKGGENHLSSVTCRRVEWAVPICISGRGITWNGGNRLSFQRKKIRISLPLAPRYVLHEMNHCQWWKCYALQNKMKLILPILNAQYHIT